MHPTPRTLQALPSRWAHFCLGIEQFIARISGLKFQALGIVVGFSGGADSSALLQTLVCLSQRCRLRIVAAHLDHGLRAESADDAAFVAQRCTELGVPLAIQRIDVAEIAHRNRMGLEEAGRHERYALYERVRVAHGADLICTAHQLNDLAEDVLMRLMRGAVWPGLGGMRAFDSRRRLLRPLLLTPKAKLVRFLTDLGRPWVEDASNQELNATRNRIRHGFLPELLKENPKFLQSVSRLWSVAQSDEAYWAERLTVLFPNLLKDGAPVTVPFPALRDMPRAKRLRICKSLLDRLGPGQVQGENLFRLDEALEQGRMETVFQFPGGKTVRIKAHEVHFEPGTGSKISLDGA